MRRAGTVVAADTAVGRDAGLKQLLAVADQNSDEMLTRDEVEQWLQLLSELGRAQILVTVIDYDQGLFELLDADHDGQLGSRELQQAAKRLSDCDVVPNGILDLSRLPRQFQLTVSCGHPRSLTFQPQHSGPVWFRAMDRNGDGEVSRREFLADHTQFERLDVDRDGFISPAESVPPNASIPE